MISRASSSAMLFSSVHAFSGDEGSTRIALELCRQLGASLTAVVLDLQTSIPGAAAASPDGAAPADRVAAELARLAGQQTVDLEVVTTLQHSFGVGGCLSHRARLHDLAIIGVDRAGLISERHLAEHLICESGRPVLVAPARSARPFSLERVVVAWDNTRSAARALNDAVALIGAQAELVLLTIDDDKDIATALDDADVQSALERRGLKVSLERRAGGSEPIGSVLQAAALELGAGMLVMGGFFHSRLREVILGGATAQVLDEPRLPVLLSH